MNPNEENQPPVPSQDGAETNKTEDTLQEIIGVTEDPETTIPPLEQPSQTAPNEQPSQQPVVQVPVEDQNPEAAIAEPEQASQANDLATEGSAAVASTEAPQQPVSPVETTSTASASAESDQQDNAETSTEANSLPEASAPQSEEAASSNTQAQPPEEAQQAKPFKKRLLFLLAPALIIITLLGILVASQVFSGGLKLATYSGDAFSIKYPAGYEEATENNATAFKEAGEMSDETLSGVIVAMDDLPADISDQQRNLIKEKLPEQVDAFLTTATAGGENEIRNEKTEDTTLAGSEAKRVTAEIYKDEQKVGTFYISSGLTQKKLVLVAVLAHTSDPELDAKAQEILNSFELKQ